MLHEAGYDYTDIPELTASEIRRLVEGKRVDAEIENMIRESKRHEDGRTSGAALGRAVPRESDDELLDDYADRMANGEVGGTSLGGR